MSRVGNSMQAQSAALARGRDLRETAPMRRMHSLIRKTFSRFWKIRKDI